MLSLFEHCHGEKTYFSRNEKRMLPLSQMNNVELVQTLSWRVNALFEERERTQKLINSPNHQFENLKSLFLFYNGTLFSTPF